MSQAPVIHPTAVVDPAVKIGDGTVIGPYCVILGPCRIGIDCRIGPHVVIGTTSEHAGEMVLPAIPEFGSIDERNTELWFGGLGCGIEIGNSVIIREFSVINQGTSCATHIGSKSFVMNSSYIAHDCQVGIETKIGPVASLAGHVSVGDQATVGMKASVHQHRRIGALAMIGMNATVVHDIAPFALAMGTPARETGVNANGLERAGYSLSDIAALETFRAGGGSLPKKMANNYAKWSESTE
jgi:UDP-N-acetylglucosamine acyltransferase